MTEGQAWGTPELISMICPRCASEVGFPPGCGGRREPCPACDGEISVPSPDYRAPEPRSEAKPRSDIAHVGPGTSTTPTDRQRVYAESLGIDVDECITAAEAGDRIGNCKKIRHYLFGLWIALVGLPAREDDYATDCIEMLAADLVNHDLDLVDPIVEVVGEDRPSAEFLPADPNLRVKVEALLRKRYEEESGGTFPTHVDEDGR